MRGPGRRSGRDWRRRFVVSCHIIQLFLARNGPRRVALREPSPRHPWADRFAAGVPASRRPASSSGQAPREADEMGMLDSSRATGGFDSKTLRAMEKSLFRNPGRSRSCGWRGGLPDCPRRSAVTFGRRGWLEPLAMVTICAAFTPALMRKSRTTSARRSERLLVVGLGAERVGVAAEGEFFAGVGFEDAGDDFQLAAGARVHLVLVELEIERERVAAGRVFHQRRVIDIAAGDAAGVVGEELVEVDFGDEPVRRGRAVVSW